MAAKNKKPVQTEWLPLSVPMLKQEIQGVCFAAVVQLGSKSRLHGVDFSVGVGEGGSVLLTVRSRGLIPRAECFELVVKNIKN